MVEDADAFHGLPVPPSPGRRSPTANGHPKQQKKHRSPCTTQASLPAATLDPAGALAAGYCPPSAAASPQRVETLLPGHVPPSSQSPGRDLDAIQDGGTGPSQHDPVSEEQHQGPQYGSEELQQRIKGMWPKQQLKSENHDGFGEAQRLASDMEAGGCSTSPLSTNPLQDGHGYETKVSSQRAWQAGSQNPLQHPTWRPFHISGQAGDHQSLYHANRLGLATPMVDDVHSSSFHPPSYAGTASNLKFKTTDSDYLNFIPTTSNFASYQIGANAGLTSTLSPCSNTLALAYEAPGPMLPDREDNVDFVNWELDQEHGMGYKDELWCPEDSPSSIEAQGGKVDEPYAQLIYRAFMSTPNKSMTLQEIYQWFRENTDKAKSEGKGWQNSIRHNLSMNGAFTKRNSKAAIRDPNDGSLSFDPAGDGRKSTEWYLEPEFIGGVESTTRYRRGNSGSRSRTGGGHARGSRHGGDAHGGYSNARVTAGRKGGNVAAQNRRRQAEKQQHARAQMAAALARGDQHGMPIPGPGPLPYQGFSGQEGNVQHYAAPARHAASSPFPRGFGGGGGVVVTDAIDQSQGQGTMQLDVNYFRSPGVSASVEDDDNSKRPTTLCNDAAPHPNEPVTPPESAHPLQPDEGLGLGGGVGGKHYESMAEIMGLYNPMGPHQGQPPAHGYGGGDQLHMALPEYTPTLGSVAGVYEALPGSQQPPVFFDPADPEAVERAVLFGIFDNTQH